MQSLLISLVLLSTHANQDQREAEREDPDYASQVAPILTKYCAGCHNDEDREGGLSLESYAALRTGGENGPALLGGQPDSSRLIRVLTGAAEPSMPPEDSEAPTVAEIAVLRAWIEAGATGPGNVLPAPVLLTPVIKPRGPVHKPVTAMAWSRNGRHTAIGRFGEFVVTTGARQVPMWRVSGLPGKVNSIRFSHDGRWVVVATGVTGLAGKAAIYDVARGLLLQEFAGHRDILYAAVLSRSRQLLATAGYDHRIVLWDVASGEQVRTLQGHNGAVYDLDFSPDGTLLGSASADETVKIWHVASGQRLDTRSEPLAEQYAVRFSPDGRFIVAGGADNRIRIWRLVSRTAPAINPLVQARFGHEGPVTHLRFSDDGGKLISAAEDRSLKLWETRRWQQVMAFDTQPAVVSALALSPDGERLLVGRMDGSTEVLPVGPAVMNRDVAAARSTPVEAAPMPGAAAAMVRESEPNDDAATATPITAPATVSGAIHASDGTDADLFRFAAKQGQSWVIEVNAARSESPLDSRIAVLDAGGEPVPRVMLRAVRDSWFNFRGKDSATFDDFRLHNWREMELNEYLYANGEVVRLWLYPRGPDSGFKVYPGRGQRYGFFDTTPTAHALHEPCYVVEPHPPGSSFIPNGLPVFMLNYENDDDARRQLGADSQLTFTAPHDGDFLVRISDTRGFQGADYSYELTVRPRRPAFKVRLNGAKPTVHPGSGREFHFVAERINGFDGPIRLDIKGVPPGFHVTSPILIQAGQELGFGTVSAAVNAPEPTSENNRTTKITATAIVAGREVTQDVGGLGEIKLEAKTALRVHLLTPGTTPADLMPGQPLELTINPGETITARVLVDRNGFKGRVDFGKDDSGRNLPHGVYVDNIGLNGLMIVEGQTEREFFITAAGWVPETSRLFHLRATAAGGQASLPVLLHVRRAGGRSAASE